MRIQGVTPLEKVLGGVTFYQFSDQLNTILMPNNLHYTTYSEEQPNHANGFDSVGQLTRVNDAKDSRGGSGGTTWVYIYDLDGNLTNKTRYAYTTGTDQLKGAMCPMINQTHCSFEMLTQHSTGISK